MPNAYEALNRIAKWRSLLSGRILGTKPADDAPTQGFRDLFEKLILLRVEVTAMNALLIKKGVYTLAEFDAALVEEAGHLEESYRKAFPGWESTEHGLAMVDLERARKTMKGWPP